MSRPNAEPAAVSGATRLGVSPSVHVDRIAEPMLPKRMAAASQIREWPAEDRPRERLYHKGAEALADAELLAIQLGTGVPGLSAVDVAREMLAQHGSLSELSGLGV